MTDDDDVELEDSPLSGELTRDGITVKVTIYRIRDSGETTTAFTPFGVDNLAELVKI